MGFEEEGGAPPSKALERDPVTCEEAAEARTYVGCDYWATITANIVSDVFDFAVVISNIGQTPADVAVTGPNGVGRVVTVAPGALEKVYLPWVSELKGPTSGVDSPVVPLASSVVVTKGAYHLRSSVPVVVYQFNPLEYAGKGGPGGKSWSECPTVTGSDCFSYTNDASLLLPSTAWTGNYRVTGINGWSTPGGLARTGTFVAITASQDETIVRLALAEKAEVLAGQGVVSAKGGEVIEIALDAGDVAQVATPPGAGIDLSGSLVQSNHPVQVIAGSPCINLPADKSGCDHVEESVLPAEALGKTYVVTTPTRPAGGAGPHVVRFYGNRDGTRLTYRPSKPTGCPDTLAAGEVAQCEGLVSTDFVVIGSQELGVATFMVGSTVYEPETKGARGDPSQSIFAATEQYRKSYLFPAPDDYEVSYAVVVGPEDAAPILDGQALTGFEEIAQGLGVWRATLGAGENGAHTLRSTQPVGLQVMGYGAYTSYQFPGGLDVKRIAPTPTK